MGFFGAYLYADGSWNEVDPGNLDLSGQPSPWLFLGVHDSDFAMLRYSPVGPGTGEAFLGFTPRTYFEDPSASAPTDTAVESAGLAAWAEAAGTGARPAQGALEPFLASDDYEGPDEDEGASDEDIFVEAKAWRFLEVFGLPRPPDLEERSW